MQMTENEIVGKFKRAGNKNKDEEQQVNKALSIPMPVRKACEERVAMLTEKVIEIEKEREIIQDYLNGVI